MLLEAIDKGVSVRIPITGIEPAPLALLSFRHRRCPRGVRRLSGLLLGLDYPLLRRHRCAVVAACGALTDLYVGNPRRSVEQGCSDDQ